MGRYKYEVYRLPSGELMDATTHNIQSLTYYQSLGKSKVMGVSGSQSGCQPIFLDVMTGKQEVRRFDISIAMMCPSLFSYSPGGDKLCYLADGVESGKGHLLRIDLPSGRIDRYIPIFNKELWVGDFSPDGNYLALAAQRSTGVLDLKGMGFFHIEHDYELVGRVQWDPKGKYLVQSQMTEAPTFLNTILRMQLRPIDALGRATSTLGFTDNMEFSNSWDYVCSNGKLFQMSPLEELAQLNVSGTKLGAAAFNPDESMAYFISDEKATVDSLNFFIKAYSLPEKKETGTIKVRLRHFRFLNQPPAFEISPDGRYAAVGVEELAIIDLATRKPIHRFTAPPKGNDFVHCYNDVAFRKNLIFAASGHHNIDVFDYQTGKKVKELSGHTTGVNYLSIHPKSDLLVSVGSEGSVILWNTSSLEMVARLYYPSNGEYLVVTPDGYYTGSSGAHRLAAINAGGKCMPMSSFDLRYNRPDIVMARLGLASSLQSKLLAKARAKRLAYAGLSEAQLGTDFKLPRIEIGKIETGDLITKVTAQADGNGKNLKQLKAYVNGVPINGVHGKSLSGPKAEVTFEVPLIPRYISGNTMRVSVLDENGAESPSRMLPLLSKGEYDKQKVHLICIGVSQFKNKDFDLEFAAKDAADITEKIEWNKLYRDPAITLIQDKKATRENILKVRSGLEKSSPNDLVILFISTHGIIDQDLNYYLATYETDFASPKGTALAYEEFESLLYGIPAQNRLILMDACHSGELDTQEMTVEKKPMANNEKVSGRGFKAAGMMPHTGAKNSFELMKNVFGDPSLDQGIQVISAAGGMEFAYEGEGWNNGVFTYVLLQAYRDYRLTISNVKSYEKDELMYVNDFRQFLSNMVRYLTNGEQTPTGRSINMDNNFVLKRSAYLHNPN